MKLHGAFGKGPILYRVIGPARGGFTPVTSSADRITLVSLADSPDSRLKRAHSGTIPCSNSCRPGFAGCVPLFVSLCVYRYIYIYREIDVCTYRE